MKVLVTGATGFIGSYVVEELLKKGCEVIATSTNISKAMQKTWYPLVTYIPFNFESFDKSKNYFSFFNEPDIVIHTAWEGLPNYKSPFHFEINFPRHFSLLENMVKNGLTDLNVTGTCFEYGLQEGCLTEDTPALPNNSYSLAKDALRK